MTRCLVAIAAFVLALGAMSSASTDKPDRSGGGLGGPSLGAAPSGLAALDTIGL